MRNLVIVSFLGLFIIIIGIVFFVIPPTVDKNMNAITPHQPYVISEEAKALHDSLNVADLHADTLLWQRNPQSRHDRGHTDLPRFRDGGYALQVFTTVTKTPSNMNYEKNSATSDDITKVAILQRWPWRTWRSIYARAAYQADRLTRVARQDDEFFFIRTQNDLQDMLILRQDNHRIMGGIMGMEGAHTLEGDIDNLDKLYDKGFRVIGLHHFFDNELGGSLHGLSEEGLTDFGRVVVQRAEDKKMIIDLAHSSEAVVRDVLQATTRPMIVSHTGIRSLCETQRNIPDELMQEITQRGGLIGIGFWEDVTCDPTIEGIAKTIKSAIEIFGEDHIALGSDFDGTIEAPLDASEMAAITQSLMDIGVSDDQIRKVMGENILRFFAETLPQE